MLPQDAAAATESSLRAAVYATEKLGRYNHKRLESREALADFFARRGRYREAEPIKVQLVAAREKIYGPEHQSLAPQLGELSAYYKAMGRFDEAEAVLNLALKINERD